MSELRPLPPSVLIRRAILQEQKEKAVFDLPARRFYAGAGKKDFSVRFHGRRASTPVGPAAGPHTQMAQNILLAWLAGSRIVELKTTQVLDRIRVSRPCIDMETIGFNVEWSQELPLHLSLMEYVKAWTMIHVLPEANIPEGLPAPERATVFDASVGYDLEGIRSARMTRFLEGLRDAGREIEAVREDLRRGLPPSLRGAADAEVPVRVADTATLSTFHGCPPEEIEKIGLHLMENFGFHLVIKMNPTLLGRERVNEILVGRLGYGDLSVPRSAFEGDPGFDEAVDTLRRLRERGKALGLDVGAKFTNTLVVENHRSFFAEEVMYMSGPPLFPIALEAALRVREAFGPELPVSFSAGVTAANYPEVVAAGFAPVTVCTDLLKQGGYMRLRAYHDGLASRMEEAGAADVEGWIVRSAGEKKGDAAALSLRNHAALLERALADPAYGREKNQNPPRRIDAALSLFDCTSCETCVHACPNNAPFAYKLPPRTIRYRDLRVSGGELVPDGEEKTLETGKGKRRDHQIAILAELCNDCGNCGVFCPEEGGPNREKPRLFLRAGAFEEDPGPAFLVQREGTATALRYRSGGERAELLLDGDAAVYRDDRVELVFLGGGDEPAEARLTGSPPEGRTISLGPVHVLRRLAEGWLGPEGSSYLTAAMELPPAPPM